MNVLAALAFVSALHSPPAAALLPRKIEPLIQMHFSVPDETKGWFGRCDNTESWNEAWSRFHKGIHDGGTQTLPALDFKKYTVVGICSPWPTAGVIPVEVIENKDTVFVRYRMGGFQFRPEPFDDDESRKRQEMAMKRMKEIYRLRLAFIVVPSTEKKIVVQVNTTPMVRHPHVWDNLAELPRK